MFANIPFMDNYQLNLDWLMKKMREIQQNWAEMLGFKDDAEQSAEDAEAQAAAAASSATEAAGAANSAQTQAAAAASSASAAQTSASQAQANAQQALTTTPITTNYQSNATVVQQLNTLNTKIPQIPRTYSGSGNANTPVIIPATSSYFAGYVVFSVQGFGAGLCAIARPSGGALGVTDIAGNSGNTALTAAYSSSDGGIKVSANNTFTITCIYDYLP